MSQPYLDSAGNVNTAVASDIQNLVFAQRTTAAIPAPAAQAMVAATAAQVATDAITGLPNVVTDV
jgi:hypothetical protein